MHTGPGFYILKDCDELLWDSCTNQSKLSVVAQLFTIKLDYGLSEADDVIVK